MSPLFSLAADFIERMSNPRYGAQVNEEYTIRFSTLLQNERTISLLKVEANNVNEVSTFSFHGWAWFLGWAKTNKVELNTNLLLDLMFQWDSIAMMAQIIDLAILDQTWKRRIGVVSLDNFQDDWLKKLLTRCTTRLIDPSKNEPVAERPDIIICRSVLLALIQAGKDITLDAAATFLNHQWEGQDQLLQFFAARYSLLDPETKELWIERLTPPFDRIEFLG